MPSPYFSIVISAYNRPGSISRCMESCLDQNFHDYEIIVVDDASTDNTYDTLMSFSDDRVRIIKHPVNRGMGAARNTGNNAAVGEWIVRLDSDFALLPYTLQRLNQLTLDVTDDIHIIGARFQWDTGEVTPYEVPDGKIDYIGRIKWAEGAGGRDWLSCTKREVFDKITWFECPNPNALFQLDQARLFKSVIYEDVLAIQFTDAPGSELRAPTKYRLESRIENAEAKLTYFEKILDIHGESLKEFGPKQYKKHLLWAAFYSFLLEKRMLGLKYNLQYLRLKPISITGWVLPFIGMVGPRAMRFGYELRDNLGLNTNKSYFI